MHEVMLAIADFWMQWQYSISLFPVVHTTCRKFFYLENSLDVDSVGVGKNVQFWAVGLHQCQGLNHVGVLFLWKMDDNQLRIHLEKFRTDVINILDRGNQLYVSTQRTRGGRPTNGTWLKVSSMSFLETPPAKSSPRSLCLLREWKQT